MAADFLVHGKLDETPATFYAGIEQIPAGSAFELTLNGACRQWRYWSLSAIEPDETTDAETGVAELLEDAVRLRLRSDVPVGVCLSGGLDSTAIICAMARERQNGNGKPAAPLLAFCYHEPAFDERTFVADTLAQTGATLRRISLTPEAMWQSLTEVLRFQDEPDRIGRTHRGISPHEVGVGQRRQGRVERAGIG